MSIYKVWRNRTISPGGARATLTGLFLARLILPPIIEGALVSTFVRRLYMQSLQQKHMELSQVQAETERLVRKIGHALAAGPNLGDTLYRIVDLAASILHVDYGAIALLAQGKLSVVSNIGAPITPPVIPLTNSVAGRALSLGRPVIVSDLTKATGLASPARQINGMRSVLAAPILHGGKRIGVIEVYSDVPDAFSDDDAAVLFSFAKQAAVAIENARSIDKLKSEAEFRQALNVITTSLLTAPDIQSILFELCKEATQLLGIDGTYIWRLDPETGELVGYVAYGYRSDLFLGKTLALDDPDAMASCAARSRQTLVQNDIDLEHQEGELFKIFSPRSQAAVPIIVGDAVTAVAVFNDRTEPLRFDEETIQKAELLAGQAAVAISKASLIDTLSRTEQVLRSTLNSIKEGIFMIGRHREVLFVNGAVSRLYGIDLSQFVGANKPDVIIPLVKHRFVDPEAFEQRLLCLYETMETESIDELQTVDGKILQRYSGPVYWDGNLLGRIEVYRDITGVRAAQAELEFRARRSRALAEIVRVVSSSLERQEVLRTVIDQACIALKADTGSIFFYNDTTGYLSGQVGYGFTDAQIRATVVPLSDVGHAEQALQDKRPVMVENARLDTRVPDRLVDQFNLKSVLVLPLLIRDRPIGAIFLNTSKEYRRFTEEEIEFAWGIATQAAIAIENARLFEAQRNISETLQKALLPSSIPEVTGLDTAICYISSTEAALVGGDFYDFITLPDKRFAFVVGDVSGKGIEAATTTAMVKQSIRAFITEDVEPASVIGRANRATVWQIERGHFITLFYALYDPEANALLYTNAGHPHPVLIFGGKGMTLPGSNMALGVSAEERYKTHVQLFERGDTLVLYTDGITEARRDHDLFGEERLIDVLLHAPGPTAAQTVGHVIGEVKRFAEGRLTDDIALVVLKRT